MKLHLAKSDGLNIFTAHGDDYVAVNHEKHERNLIVLPDLLIPDWSTVQADALTANELSKLLDLKAEVILLGTGSRQRFPAMPLLRPFAEKGIGLEVMDTPAACRTYNILATEGRKVAAAILLD